MDGWGAPQGIAMQQRDRRQSGDKFREMSQRGYDRLIDLLRADCVDDLVDQLTEFDCVENLMRDVPTLVPVLLELAWNARQSEHLSDYFQSAETGAVADSKDTPLAPCGRSFANAVHGHLIGAARLYFNGIEKRWSTDEAKTRSEQYQAGRSKKRRNPIGLFADLLRSLFNGHPVFSPSEMRQHYNGRGLYTVLKPLLLDPDQFQLIPYYAQFNARQVKSIGSLLRGMHTPDSIAAAAGYDSRKLIELSRCALMFARTVLSFSNTSEIYARPQRPSSALNNGVERDEVLAGEVLAYLITEKRSCVEDLLNNLVYAEPVIKACAAKEGHGVWALFGDSLALDNIALCPEEIVHGIGALAGSISPEVSSALDRFDNPTIPRDFLLYAQENFDEEIIRSWLSDDTFLPVWQSMPSKFNADFSYSRDAQTPGHKNFSDLKAASTGLFRSFNDLSPPDQADGLKQAA